MSDDRIVHTDDGASSAMGAASLIQVIVWSIVVLVRLAVALLAIHHCTHLF
jgi:hypothetical protein